MNPYNTKKYATGSISSVVREYVWREIQNDGEGVVNYKQIESESQLTAGANADIILRLTENEFTHTQLDETFINLEIPMWLRFNTNPFKVTNATGTVFQRGMFLFVGYKNSSDALKDYVVYHNGVTVTGTLQNDASIESALNHITDGKITKSNRQHCFSLYTDVQKRDHTVCGVYIPYSDLANIEVNNRLHRITMNVNIPIESILPFEGFSVYPHKLFGELKIRFKVNTDSLVFAMVDPLQSVKQYFYTHQLENTGSIGKTRRYPLFSF